MQMNRTCSILSLLCGLLAWPCAFPAEETAVVTEHKINVRGQPSFVGEVVTQLSKGDKVTVIEQIRAEKPKAGEPTNWAKIKLPANVAVWVFAPFVKDGKVSATRLNLRAGPGENYSVLGRLAKDAPVKSIRTVEEWMEIEAPADAYAFIDGSLIKPQDGSTPVPAVVAVAPAAATPPPQTTQPALTPPPATVAAQPEQTKPVPDALAPPTTTPVTPAATPPVAAATTTTLPATPAIPENLPQVAQPPPEKPEQPVQKRIVRREGIIRATKSIQAPTWYELAHPETKKTINYLFEEKLGVKLKEYKGQRVIVSGQEGVDPRWPNTPILEVETLDIAP